MQRVTLILTALMMLSLTAFWLPSVLAMQRGRLLQTMALWLAIILALALLYKNFGADSTHPVFDSQSAPANGAHKPTIPVDIDRG